MFATGVDKPGSHVEPGHNFTYEWQVLEGPSPSDAPCIPYLYYSASNPVADTNSGLVGPLLVCKKGALSENATQVACVSVRTHTLFAARVPRPMLTFAHARKMRPRARLDPAAPWHHGPCEKDVSSSRAGRNRD